MNYFSWFVSIRLSLFCNHTCLTESINFNKLHWTEPIFLLLCDHCQNESARWTTMEHKQRISSNLKKTLLATKKKFCYSFLFFKTPNPIFQKPTHLESDLRDSKPRNRRGRSSSRWSKFCSRTQLQKKSDFEYFLTSFQMQAFKINTLGRYLLRPDRRLFKVLRFKWREESNWTQSYKVS